MIHAVYKSYFVFFICTSEISMIGYKTETKNKTNLYYLIGKSKKSIPRQL